MDESIDDDACLDLSLREFWVIVHYTDCDPGNEFEILHEKRLVGDSWETLERGVEVAVKFGNARVQAFIVLVSDDLQYLQKNFASITEEFSSDMQETKVFPKYEQYRTQKEIIKVKDKEVQTENNNLQTNYDVLKREHEALKTKYDALRKVFDGLKMNLKNALSTANVLDEVNDVNVLKPFNRYNAPKTKNLKENEDVVDKDDKMVYIGTHRTPVPKEMYESVNWLSYSAATRKLLISVFPKKVLSTHSLTGKPSPAFIGVQKQAKMRLDPIKISDIVEIVSKKCRVSESIVRSAITTKCADENKMSRKRMERKLKEENDENVPAVKKQKCS